MVIIFVYRIARNETTFLKQLSMVQYWQLGSNDYDFAFFFFIFQTTVTIIPSDSIFWFKCQGGFWDEDRHQVAAKYFCISFAHVSVGSKNRYGYLSHPCKIQEKTNTANTCYKISNVYPLNIFILQQLFLTSPYYMYVNNLKWVKKNLFIFFI